MIIKHNLNAMYARRQNKINTLQINKNIEKLSSGLQINRASDNAAGLAISEKMRAQITGLHQAERNASDGISFIQTTEGFLQETQNVLHRIRELSIQAANGTITASDRQLIQIEVSQLIDEVNRIASHAQFNNMNLLTGAFAQENGVNTISSSMWLHIGSNTDQRERLYIGTMTSQALGLQSKNGLPHTASFITVQTQNNANNAIAILDNALNIVSTQRANLGAYQNRIESAQRSIAIGAENLQAAESRIRDTDMAHEMVEFTKNNILLNANTAMLAQANAIPQQVLQLLQ